MSKTQFSVVVVLLVGILGFVAFPSFVQLAPHEVVAAKPVEIVPSKSEPAKWEYKIDSYGDESVVTTLNELGSDGWEVISARRATGYGGSASYEFILRRAK
jgi:hypothetical protein